MGFLSVRFELTDTQRLEACGEDPGTLCDWVADRTDSVLVAQLADFAVDKPIRIALILVIAFFVSRLLRSMIDRFGRRLAHRSADRLARIERRTPRLNQFADSGAVADPAANGRSEQRVDTVVSVISSLATVVVWATAGVMILGLFSINLAPLFAGAGVVGVALGFGAQSVVADFLSGFFMLFEDQYGVGDVVDLGEASGTVENLSLRTTTIRDVNGTVWHIRNSEIRRVGNKSQLWSRAVLDIDVAYDTDLRRAEGIIQRVADDLWQDPDFTDGDIIDPPEVWGIERLGADGVTIRLVVKTDPAEQWVIGRELRLRIKEALEEAGIEIPFPQRTIWLRHDDTAVPREERPEVEVAPLRIPEATEELVQNPEG
ncbi:MAG: mechanosensitive ion channel family protein [Actinomycetota bacterium]